MTSNILNLAQYRIERVEEAEHDYHVYAETLKPRMVCECGSHDVSRWGAHEQVIKDLPMHGKRVAIYVKTRRFRCTACEKTGFERLPAVSEKRAMTERLVRWIGAQSLKRTFSAVAEDVGVTEGTVRNIFRDHVTDLEAQVRFEVPRWLGIDEIHIIRKPRCVVSNIEARAIVNILPDRNKRTVTGYLHAMRGRERVKYVAMDMWTPYRDAVAAVLPDAKVVIDKFHVLRMANVAMEHVRKGLRAGLAPKERRGLMHDRFLLLKREHELTAQERFLVDSWSKTHPELGEAYRLKEAFFGIYDAEDKHDAVDRYGRWAASIPQPLKAAFSPITTAWRSWHDPILNYFDHPITNAYTESLNSLIRVMNRLGRGYSFEALRAKILFTEGLHKHVNRRPKWERRALRRAAGDSLMSAMMTYDALRDVNRRSTPDEDDDRILGVDISTLTERIESGRF
jgi:transposase